MDGVVRCRLVLSMCLFRVRTEGPLEGFPRFKANDLTHLKSLSGRRRRPE